MADAAPELPATPLDEPWRAEFTLQGWLLGLDGTVGARGRTAGVNADFLDLVDGTDSLFGLGGRVEVGRERFTLYLDGMYDRATNEGATGPRGIADIDVTFEETLLDFGVMYRVLRTEHGPAHMLDGASAPLAGLDADLYLGGRFMSLDLELDPARRPPVSSEQDWTDPVVGARIRLPLGEGFRLAINGDVGGFGVSSEFAWSATALVEWDFTLFGAQGSLELGYRAIGSDYADGEGAGRFEWDVVQHGALVGLSLRF